MVLTANEIRNGFIDFFKDKDHTFVPSSPIVPVDDQTLLFTNAGMNQFKNVFLGLTAPHCRRAVNSQKCLRVSGKHNDLEQVGKDTYHHTFFEMLGNWSFDDYFKAEAIQWAWQLLTDVWGIDPDKLWATVFAGDKADNLPQDKEALDLWPKVTALPKERVLAFGKKDNFWEMDEVGPCGPCSEIHIDLGPASCDMKNVPGHKCAVNAGCARFIELWNLVFIQYSRDEAGRLAELGAKYVDTGAGLERVAAVLQKRNSNYDTDLFMPIITATEKLTVRKYTQKLGDTTDNAFRVIADHIRSLVFAITDGATPSNDGRGYVIRRILRRASRFGRLLDMHQPFLYKLTTTVCDCLGDAFGEIRQRADFVSTVIEAEEAAFGRTLDRGLDIFEAAAGRAEKSAQNVISGEDAFQLYDTYGFPLDLTQLMAEERKLAVDTTGFEKLMQQQRDRARAAQKDTSLVMSLADADLPPTEDLHKYMTSSCRAKVLGFIDEKGFTDAGRIETDKETAVVLDRTCFYAEAGGQVGDCGILRSEKCEFVVEDTIKIADCILHKGRLLQGTLSVGDTVEAIVSKDRLATQKNHTATHLLQWALQTVIDKSISQQGSLVTPEYLRFDFTYPKALTAEQIKEVEKAVREKIAEDLPVSCTVLPREQAEKLGAMALFGEKYGELVRVVAVGADKSERLGKAFSKEFCGGTHVDRIGSIGGFKMIKEESISAGVRRITALTGNGLTDYLEKRSDIVDKLSETLKVPAEQIVERVEKLIKDNKKLARQLKSAARQTGTDIMAEARTLLEKCEKVNNSSIVIGRLSSGPVEQARAAIDMLKKKAKSAVIVLGFEEDGRAALLAGVTDDLIKKGLKAGDIVKEIATIIDGGGGGRPQLAEAGGKNPARINQALDTAEKLIKEKLSN
jgi:alanyl-tRNA synthetase